MMAIMENGNIFDEFAFVIPQMKWIYKLNGTWNLSQPVGRDGILHFLLERGMPHDQATTALKTKSYLRVFGADMSPGRPALYRDAQGNTFINLWVAPNLKPHPGDYPRIERILLWLCGGDEDGVDYLVNWLAFKIQNPGHVPRTALVFSTRPGAGKGTLFRAMEEMVGRENCVNIEGGALENRFNARWATKLVVLGDEVMSSENQRDVSQKLKILIDSPVIELEKKGIDQLSVTNRLAWIFASNDTLTPVNVEKGDRRYSIFSNHEPLTEDYRLMVVGCYESEDSKQFTASFVKELQAFYYDLLHLPVDRPMVATPYQNEARQTLIEANLLPHELFIRDVMENGIDGFIDGLIQRGDYTLTKMRPSWDFGDEGVSTQVVYQCYVEYVRAIGGRPLKLNKLGAAVKNAWPSWEHVRNTAPGGQRVSCYRVKRSQKGK